MFWSLGEIYINQKVWNLILVNRRTFLFSKNVTVLVKPLFLTGLFHAKRLEVFVHIIFTSLNKSSTCVYHTFGQLEEVTSIILGIVKLSFIRGKISLTYHIFLYQQKKCTLTKKW